jgi:hypothetical protein
VAIVQSSARIHGNLMKKYLFIALTLFAVTVQAAPQEGDYAPTGSLASPETPLNCAMTNAVGIVHPIMVVHTGNAGEFGIINYHIDQDGVRTDATQGVACQDNGNGNGFTCSVPESVSDFRPMLDAVMSVSSSEWVGAAFGPNNSALLFTEAPGAELSCYGDDCLVVEAWIGLEFSCGAPASGHTFARLADQ